MCIRDSDVIGTGRRIELDEIQNIVTFIGDARLRQDRDAIEGERIVYDMARDRMIVRGGDASPTRTTRAGEDSDTTLPTQDGERPKMVLQPDALGDESTGASTPSATRSTPSTSEQAYVGETGAPVFATQSVTGASLGTLPGGLPVRVLRLEDGWAQVNAPHSVRVWIYGKFVSADSGIATVTGSAVRLRSIPSTDASSVVLGEAAKGQRVRVLSVRGKWKEIEASADLKVWIPSPRIEASEDPSTWERDWRESSSRAADG